MSASWWCPPSQLTSLRCSFAQVPYLLPVYFVYTFVQSTGNLVHHSHSVLGWLFVFGVYQQVIQSQLWHYDWLGKMHSSVWYPLDIWCGHLPLWLQCNSLVYTLISGLAFVCPLIQLLANLKRPGVSTLYEGSVYVLCLFGGVLRIHDDVTSVVQFWDHS